MTRLIVRLGVALLTFLVSLGVTGIVVGPYAESRNRETVLEADLRDMRRAIDQYTADEGHLPSSLEALVSNGYLMRIPIDPITGAADWKVDIEEDMVPRRGGAGVVDVHSAAPGVGSDRIPYMEY